MSIILFNALYMKVFIIPNLDAHHIRTNFITKANYHAVLKDSQNNIVKQESISSKITKHTVLKKI